MIDSNLLQASPMVAELLSDSGGVVVATMVVSQGFRQCGFDGVDNHGNVVVVALVMVSCGSCSNDGSHGQCGSDGGDGNGGVVAATMVEVDV